MSVHSDRQNTESAIEKLLTVMARLRDPVIGCPWDVEQDFRSIAASTIEEAYEVVDAIENDDFEHLREELGDLLFQVVFYAQMAREQQRFQFEDIVQAITDKLVRRHPHVFPDGTIESRVDPNNRPSEEFVTQQWEAIKKQERQAKGNNGLLSDVPLGLPSMTRAHKLQKRAADIGFDWAEPEAVLDKLEEEIAELKQAMQANSQQQMSEELGDCFFTLVNLSRHLKMDSDSSLRAANQKFTRRFQFMEQCLAEQKRRLEQLSVEEMEELWDKAKSAEKSSIAL